MPTPAGNVPSPFVLSDAAFDLSDRLVATLTTLVHALVDRVTPASTPTAAHAALSLLRRLTTIVATFIRIVHGRPGRPPKPTTPAAPTPEPRPLADRTSSPRRPPGWLLAALPDLAPAIAADLAALFADPAFATLLAAAPTLPQHLRPFLRGLGLTPLQIPSPAPPDAPPPDRPPPDRPPPDAAPRTAPTPANPALPRQAAEAKTHPPNSASLHDLFVTLS